MTKPDPIPAEKRDRVREQLEKLVRQYIKGDIASFIVPPRTKQGNVFPVISESARTEKAS